MIKKSKITRLLSLSFAAVGFGLLCGDFSHANAQNNDPFSKPTWAKPRTTGTTTTSGQPKADKPKPAGPPPVVVVTAPPIESRIAYYKNLRENAAANGLEIPKVTSVLTLDEMAVIGIFRTPRGYAAMVEAKPIKLSYTIYPGEKFFDGQLVAIEENRLVFRKVTKMSNNKFVASVENKALRQYTVEQEVQGTAPVQQPAVKSEEPTQTVQVPKEQQSQSQPPIAVAPSSIVSPLEEMNKQPVEDATKTTVKEKPSKKGKKPVKVADNKKTESKN
jgi:hypothetical protein